MQEKNELLKSLPKVDVLLADKKIGGLKGTSRTIVLEAIRETLDLKRKRVLSGEVNEISCEEIVDEIIDAVRIKNTMHLKRVVNGTGTVLHTNLGRAVLARSAVEAVISISSSYSNLEFDIEGNERGSRYSHVEELICKITGAEAALVVNNNAAAVMLALSTLAKEREAIVSRGELVEIGGSFRIPAVMELSGARLVEVGTTNRTHLYDYENAVNENTGVILKVHQSNFRILGFTEGVGLEELVSLGRRKNMPVLEDIGSGVFIDVSKFGLSYEPTVQASIRAGVDVVTFSGDKLLGGPQAGIIAGKREYIAEMKKNQLTRALRIDKMTLAALEATLRLYLDEDRAAAEIPVVNMLSRDIETIKKDAVRLCKTLRARLGGRLRAEALKDFSQVGGGAMPLERLDTYTVAIKPVLKSVEKLEEELRKSPIPIITRIYRDSIVIDVRTLFSEDYRIIADTLDRLL